MSSYPGYLTSQLIMGLAMYAGTFFSYYLPIRYFRPRLSNKPMLHPATELDEFDQQRQTQRILSQCNCLATGIFIAMCFISLMPMVNEEFHRFLVAAQLEHINYPLGELTMLLGFFLMLLLENRLLKWRTSSKPFLHLDEDHVDHDESDEHRYKLLNNGSHTPLPGSDGGAAALVDHQMEQHAGNLDQKSSGRCYSQSDLHMQPLNDFHHDLHFVQPGHHQHDDHDHHHHHLDLSEMPSEFNTGFFMLIFASGIHSVFEGLALGLIKDVGRAVHLFVGIWLHECLVSIALGIQACKMQKGAAFGLVFALTIPTGILLGLLIGYTPGLAGQLISAICQGLAAGTFIHVTFYELMPSELHHGQAPDFQLKKILLIFIGFMIMALLAAYCD